MSKSIPMNILSIWEYPIKVDLGGKVSPTFWWVSETYCLRLELLLIIFYMASPILCSSRFITRGEIPVNQCLVLIMTKFASQMPITERALVAEHAHIGVFFVVF